ncbi:MAG: RHS repeat-associated core domain-containing protein [Spirochaetales bacterium]|nr:RHS repeat-associated core domain-containing protein [Spirochaetales bacterium]
MTDYKGEQFSQYEYTPHGELWIEKTDDKFEYIPYKFTGSPLDTETNLYYIGARYLNPKTAVWLSADPALIKYIPASPFTKNATSKNSKLPGSGGLFNYVNFDLYTYAANNPVKYVDPTGSDFIILNDWDAVFLQGHQAILVGNDSTGWMYFSRDDFRQSDPDNMSSNGIRKKEFTDLKEYYNNKQINKNYNRNLVMTSTPAEDKKMIDKGKQIFNENLPYDLNFENCADLVDQVLESIDIESMEGTKEWALTPMLPDVQYDNVKKNNEDRFVGELVDGKWTFDYDKSMQSDYTYDKKGQIDANTN